MTHRRFTVPSLVGGVGRQSSDKRLATEAENIDNCLVTVEKSAEKRMGTEYISSGTYTEMPDSTTFAGWPCPGSLLFNIIDDATGERFVPTESQTSDMLFKWVSIDSSNRFLIAINFGLGLTNSDTITEVEKKKFITVWKLNPTSKAMELQTFDTSTIDVDVFNYITNNPNALTSNDSIDFALFGTALIMLNKNVKAGYRSDSEKDINGNTLFDSQNLTNTRTVDNIDYEGKAYFTAAENNSTSKSFYSLRANVVGEADDKDGKVVTTQYIDSSLSNGVRKNLLEVEFIKADSTSQAKILVTKYLEPASEIKLEEGDYEVLSGTAPLNGPDGLSSSGWTLKFNIRKEDLLGRPINYRVSAIPTTVGKNLLPISETTKLSDLNVNPITKLFNGDSFSNTDGTEFTVLAINNKVSDEPIAGNVKDPSAATVNDKYYTDHFYINRGSIQYTVELNEFDTKTEPGNSDLTVPSSIDFDGVDNSTLPVKQKLLPVTQCTASPNVSGAGEVTALNGTTITFDTTKTLGDLKSIIEESGADATLKIDGESNTVQIIDASQENLVLTANADNFISSRTGNQNFIESLGLGGSEAKSIKTISHTTKFIDIRKINDDGEVETPFTGTDTEFNDFVIYDDQNPVGASPYITITVANLTTDTGQEDKALITLGHLAQAIFVKSNGDYKLVYNDDTDGTRDVRRTLNDNQPPDSADDNPSNKSVGVKIIATNNTYIPKNSVPFVRDTGIVLADTTHNMTTNLGIRHRLEDYTLVVEDKNFDITNQKDLGQSIVSFQNISIPPEKNDTIKNNAVHDTLFSLYDAGPLASDANLRQNGKGKVYECRERFFDFVPGFYRTVNEPSEGNPYYEQVRAEASFGVLDEKTWPIILDFDTGESKWKFVKPPWQPRLSGTETNNPGPSVLIDPLDPKKRVRKSITALTVWRNRLWFAIEDTIFSSEFGNFFNMYLTDPSTVVDTDVIDVRSSIDKVSKINSMISFYDYLFINTDNDVQFELQGSENQITPFTAELSPTTFYSTDPIARPQLLGSQIYFFAPSKIYLYYSNASQTNITQAIEVTQHAEYYLPENFGAITRAPSQDTIVMVDKDQQNNLYLYTNRFSGDKVIQNSLFRYIFDDDIRVKEMEVFDNYLYMVSTRTFTKKGNSEERQFFVERALIDSPNVIDKNIPRIDNLIETIFDSTTGVYDAARDVTTFTLPVHDPTIDVGVLSKDWKELSFRSIPFVNQTDPGKFTKIITPGKYIQNLIFFILNYESVTEEAVQNENYNLITDPVPADNQENYGLITEALDQIIDTTPSVYFGRKYLMNIELSRQFLRNQDQTIIDGTLNLRTIMTRYFNSGTYSIVVKRRDNEDVISTETRRDPLYKEAIYDQNIYDLPATIDSEGEFIAKVYGNSENMRVFIQSDEYTPVNVTHIEFKGIFKQQYRSAQN